MKWASGGAGLRASSQSIFVSSRTAPLARRHTRKFGKGAFAARATAKEGLWIAQNTPAASAGAQPHSLAAAVRWSPAVQLLEGEARLAERMASSTSSTSPASTTCASGSSYDSTAHNALLRRALEQQRATAEHRREAASVLRARERERNRDGKPLFWIEKTANTASPLASASSSATGSSNVSGAGQTLEPKVSNSLSGIALATSPDGPSARTPPRAPAPSDGGGDKYSGGWGGENHGVPQLLAFLAFASLPLVFGLGRRYESSLWQQRPGVSTHSNSDGLATDEESQGPEGRLALIPDALPGGQSVLLPSAGMAPDEEEAGLTIALPRPAGPARVTSRGWFWSSESRD